jgi:excisionase family DNA binding protein
MPDREWLGLGEAAAILGVHPSTLRTWSDRDEIPSRRTAGGHRRFRRTDLELWGAAHRNQSLEEIHVVVHSAIGRTRMEVADGRLRQQPWYLKLSEEQRQHYRDGSRRLMTELIRSTRLGPEDMQAIARPIGVDYARIARQAGMTPVEAAEAFLFFREFLMDSIFNLYETAGVRSAQAWGDMRRRVSRFTNLILLALLETCFQN